MTQVQTTKRVLDSKDVQTIFGVSPMTVYNWRRGLGKKGIIPHHEIKRGSLNGWVFYEHEILAWANKHRIIFLESMLGKLGCEVEDHETV